MNSNENTIYGTAQEQPKNESKQNTADNNSWQQVSIGGVTGILMGAAGMYAANAFAGEQPAEADEQQVSSTDGTQSHTAANGLRVAEVGQDLSFGEAFEAARNEVGPGGVFHWHGGIYNTYTAQEWNSMSAGERAQFAQQVQPEVQPGEEHTGHQQDVAHQPKPQPKPVVDDTDKPESKPETPVGPKRDDEEPEVHFLGVEQVQTESGRTMNVGHMVRDGQDVALVDMDNDLVFDVSMSDRNQNGKIDDEEVIDISDHQLSVTDFALATAMQQRSGDPAHPELASTTQQDHIAEDMPDYMNDADVQTI